VPPCLPIVAASPTLEGVARMPRKAPRSVAELEAENARLRQELAETLEQQTALGQVLGIIARSPGDVQSVLDAVAEHAVRVCDAAAAVIFRVEGNTIRPVARHGAFPAGFEVPGRLAIEGGAGASTALGRDTVVGRAVVDRATVRIADLAEAVKVEFPTSRQFQERFQYRAVVATPLLRKNDAIGVLYVQRYEPLPFSEKQIELLQTFADQAVIAIENAGLFEGLEQRNRDLSEALEQQTATAEVLQVIASSPNNVQPVLEAVVETVTRLCDVQDVVIYRPSGGRFVHAAWRGPIAQVMVSVFDESERRG